MGGPVTRLEQAHFPGTGFAPGGGFAVAVPDAYLPVVPLARCGGGAAVGHVHRLVGGDLAGLPREVLALGQCPGVGGDADFVGRLGDVAAPGDEAPAQAGLGDVGAERVLPVLAAEAFDFEALGHGRQRGQGQQQQGQQGGGWGKDCTHVVNGKWKVNN
jgi:hypothetical protein